MRNIFVIHVRLGATTVTALAGFRVPIGVADSYPRVTIRFRSYPRTDFGVRSHVVAQADALPYWNVARATVGLETALFEARAELALRLGLLTGLIAPILVAGVQICE